MREEARHTWRPGGVGHETVLRLLKDLAEGSDRIFWALAQELGDGGNEDLLYAMRRQVLAAVGVVA